MHRRRCACRDRHVIGARKAGNRALRDRAKAGAHEAIDGRDDAVTQATLKVRGVAPIDADHDNGSRRPPIGDVIELYGGSGHVFVTGAPVASALPEGELQRMSAKNDNSVTPRSGSAATFSPPPRAKPVTAPRSQRCNT